MAHAGTTERGQEDRHKFDAIWPDLVSYGGESCRERRRSYFIEKHAEHGNAILCTGTSS